MAAEDLSESFCHIDDDNILAINERLSADGMLLENMEEKYRDSIAVVEVAMSQNLNSLQFASERLKNNTFIIEKVSQHPNLIKFAGENVRDNAKIIKHVIKHNGSLLQYASERLKSDPEIVRIAGILGLRHAMLEEQPTKKQPETKPKQLIMNHDTYALPLLFAGFCVLGALMFKRYSR